MSRLSEIRTLGAKTARADAFGSIGLSTKVLWVTSTGGHLTELALLSEKMGSSADSLWLTFDTPQSRSVLGNRRMTYVPYVSPRGVRGTLKAAVAARALFNTESFDACISSGAAVAAGVLPVAAMHGVPTFYVESLARTSGPSATGLLMAAAPRVVTMTQHQNWASRRWPYAGSVLDDWSTADRVRAPSPWGGLKVLVTLGTIRPYRFDRIVDALLKVLIPEDTITWQLGSTTRNDLPGTVLSEVSVQELEALSRQADVVITHSGVGSLLQQLSVGNSPLLAVRDPKFGEHVDDHQKQIANEMTRRGLADIFNLHDPDRRQLVSAASRSIVRAAVKDTK